IVNGKPMTQHFFNVRLATKPIRRISHHSVHDVIRQLTHDLKAVALIERPVRHRATSREKAANLNPALKTRFNTNAPSPQRVATVRCQRESARRAKHTPRTGTTLDLAR